MRNPACTPLPELFKVLNSTIAKYNLISLHVSFFFLSIVQRTTIRGKEEEIEIVSPTYHFTSTSESIRGKEYHDKKKKKYMVPMHHSPKNISLQ